MAKNLAPFHHIPKEEEDYIIHMDMSSSPQHPARARDNHFEFQLDDEIEDDNIPSPADELFYRGNLLPLHLPPRLRLVENLLKNPSTKPHQHHSFSTTAPSTPFESCNISPATSCYVSGELKPEEVDLILDSHMKNKKKQQKKLWSKNLKLIKQYSSLGLKLKASSAYLKALFAKSSCSYEENCATDRKRTTPSSNKSNGMYNNRPEMMRRSSSVGSENECSVQAAIAYCKKSHQQETYGRKSVSDVEFYLLSGSMLAADDGKMR